MNLPNQLTMSRMLLVPVFVFIYLTNLIPSPLKDYLAAIVFTVASLTDLLDGKLARKMNLVSDFGKFMDPLADKLLVGSALICFTASGIVPAWAVVILIGREFVISGFRLVAAGKGVVIAADIWGKLKTTVQMAAMVMLMMPWDLAWFRILSLVGFYASVVLSVISVVNYLTKNKAVLQD
ncbi:MAG: CDP-diacylglycerol--glycerol-3-phosphate 3-phosphatidyltransferase [Lachnospiraceae bacterium]|nr:CDP-diacylglycerol--glycerol-3-phosphate 3-phosphatidyltransferase [Lachnospiraceae bacterium]